MNPPAPHYHRALGGQLSVPLAPFAVAIRYGYYFWPSTGDGSLLNTIASVFLGGTSVFGGTGSVVGTFVASFIIGAINAGIVSAGVNAFYTQLASAS